MRLLRLTSLFALIVASAAMASTAGASVEGKTVEIMQELYDANGDPSFTGGAVPDGNKLVEWQRCLPQAACAPIGTHFSSLDAGETPAGTTFTIRRHGVTNPEVITSHTWGGRLTNIAPPQATGGLTAMSRLALSPGLWAGGWPGDSDAVTVFACRYLTSKNCEIVTGAWYPDGDEPVDRPIGVKFTGWHLLVVDYRNPADAAWPAMALGPVRANPLARSDSSVAINNLGRIETHRRYRVSVPASATLRRGDRFKLATVTCPRKCTVTAQLSVMHKYEGWSMKARYKISGTGTIRPRWHYPVPGDKLSYSLSIKDAPLADGHLRLRR